MRDHDDAMAWARFIEVYSPLIYGFCRMRGLQSSDAADVTQEVLVRVARSIRKFEYDRSRGLFRDWLATIVFNEIRRLAGRRSPERPDLNWDEVLGSDSGPQWNEHFQQHIYEAALERCRQYFEPRTWDLFRLSWLEHVPAPEVASREEVKVEHVYVARSRVLKRLKHEIALLLDDAT